MLNKHSNNNSSNNPDNRSDSDVDDVNAVHNNDTENDGSENQGVDASTSGTSGASSTAAPDAPVPGTSGTVAQGVPIPSTSGTIAQGAPISPTCNLTQDFVASTAARSSNIALQHSLELFFSHVALDIDRARTLDMRALSECEASNRLPYTADTSSTTTASISAHPVGSLSIRLEVRSEAVISARVFREWCTHSLSLRNLESAGSSAPTANDIPYTMSAASFHDNVHDLDIISASIFAAITTSVNTAASSALNAFTLSIGLDVNNRARVTRLHTLSDHGTLDEHFVSSTASVSYYSSETVALRIITQSHAVISERTYLIWAHLRLVDMGADEDDSDSDSEGAGGGAEGDSGNDAEDENGGDSGNDAEESNSSAARPFSPFSPYFLPPLSPDAANRSTAATSVAGMNRILVHAGGGAEGDSGNDAEDGNGDGNGMVVEAASSAAANSSAARPFSPFSLVYPYSPVPLPPLSPDAGSAVAASFDSEGGSGSSTPFTLLLPATFPVQEAPPAQENQNNDEADEQMDTEAGEEQEQGSGSHPDLSFAE